MRKECGNCDHYHAPPDTWKGRPDIGACPDIMRDNVNEKDCCADWKEIIEED